MNAGRRPRVFIGCTTEKCVHAKALQQALASWSEVEIWNQGLFTPSATFIESLEQFLPEFDLAVFVLTSEDITLSRGTSENTPRDNLVFEVGLSMGLLGRLQTFLICPEGQRLKLPSDLLAVTILDYNPSYTNLQAAFAPASHAIQQTVERHPIPANAHLPKMLRQIAPSHREDFQKIINRFCEDSFTKWVIRKTWTVDIEFDLSDLPNGKVSENMIFNFDCVNISSKVIQYPVEVMSLDDTQRNELFSLSKEVGGKREIIELQNSGALPGVSGLSSRRGTIQLAPGVVHHIKLKYINKYPTSPNNCWLHNALSTLDHVIEAKISVTIPDGYTMDMLSNKRIEPDKWGTRWDFRIPSPLLAHQMIEYMFYKKNEHT